MRDLDARTGNPLDRLLFAHPRTLGESYLEHAGIAARFGAAMVAGGIKCLIHAAVPALYARAASDRVAELNAELARRRAAAHETAWDYVI